MPLQSDTLKGNARLDQAAAGGPSVKKRPPDEDPDAVARIQRALVELGHPLPMSFASGSADGIFGNETFNAVVAFQKKVFPGNWQEWDGRVGQKTLDKMDQLLPRSAVDEGQTVPGGVARIVTRCFDTTETVAVVASAFSLRPEAGPPRLPGRTA